MLCIQKCYALNYEVTFQNRIQDYRCVETASISLICFRGWYTCLFGTSATWHHITYWRICLGEKNCWLGMNMAHFSLFIMYDILVALISVIPMFKFVSLNNCHYYILMHVSNVKKNRSYQWYKRIVDKISLLCLL